MSVDLQAARLMLYHAAWLSDTQGPTPTTLAALYRAKYLVGEAVGPDHPYGPHPGRSACAVQDVPPGTAVSGWCRSPNPVSATRFVSSEPGHYRVRIRS